MSEQGKGIVLLLVAALSWSLGGLLIKLVDLSPLGLAGARSAIAAVMIWAYMRWFAPQVAPSAVDRRRERTVVALGALAYAGTVIMFVVATKTTTAANAILLQYTAPIWVAILSPIFLRERVSSVDWIAIAFTLVGMGIFFLDELTPTGTLGLVLSVLSGVFFAFCIVAVRYGRAGSSIRMVLVGNVLTAVICFPFLIGDRLPSEDVLPLIVLGVVQLGLGYIFFVRGMMKVTAVEGALIPVLEPLLNPIWVALVVDETPSIHAIVGGTVVLAAVTARGVWEAGRRRRAGNDPSRTLPSEPPTMSS